MTAPAIRRIPTYAPHIKLQVSGQLGLAGAVWEIFSYSLAMSHPANALVEDAYGQGLIDELLAFHALPATGITGYARVTEVKIARVLPDGKWEGQVPLFRRVVDVQGGVPSAGPLVNAPQVALACTLRTALPGPRARGRFYLPLPAFQANGGDGMIAPASAAQVAGSVGGLVNGLNGRARTAAVTDRVVVASTFGANNAVNRVQVGRVLDTMRSRRNNLRELYALGPVIT